MAETFSIFESSYLSKQCHLAFTPNGLSATTQTDEKCLLIFFWILITLRFVDKVLVASCLEDRDHLQVLILSMRNLLQLL